MKLPNFLTFEPLNRLRRRMGIPDDVFGEFNVSISAPRLSELELEKLASHSGIEVAWDDVTVLPDGTLAYKNSRVLLYIRDVHQYGTYESLPRFHVAFCAKLSEMKEGGKLDRYVVATNLDGHFQLNIMKGSRRQSGTYPLSVCQRCLDMLHFDGFSMVLPSEYRRSLVSNFSMEGFFKRYPISLHGSLPRHNADNAPLNDYTPDFPQISREIKESAGWKCQDGDCCIDLSAPSLRRFLHVHHKNTLKHDNSRGNLVPLCIACHAKQPNHAHLKNDPQYREFVALMRPTAAKTLEKLFG